MSPIAISTRARLRPSLIAGASAIALWAGPGLAQDTAADGSAEQDVPIVVTGSRLVTNNMTSPVPTTAVQAEELEAMDPGALISSVSQLPQFYGNTTPNSSNFFVRGGTGNLNLRGLGQNRTLTLLNGRRVPSTSAFGGVDINLFPEAMINGLETVTGGASAAYGTDAVAGVVNFLLDTNFEGLEANAQYGVTDRGDGDSYELKAAYGMALGERGHVLVAGSYADQKGIHEITSRDWYTNTGAVQVNGIWYDFANTSTISGSFDGIISSPNAAINGLAFNRDGSFAPFVAGSPTMGAIGGAGPTAGRTVNGPSAQDLNSELFTLYPDTDRWSVFAYGEYDLTDNVKVFAQYMHGYNHQFQYNNPRSSLIGSPTAITIFQDNAFLPTALRDLMVANNIASFALRRVGSIEDIGDVWFEDKVNQDVGTIGFETEIETGGLFDGWQVDGYYQYGKSKRVWDQYTLRVDRIFAAVDAVRDTNGNIVCRVSTFAAGAAAFPGCQPLNLFGRGNASAEAVDWVLGNDAGVSVNTPLYFANLGFTGETYQYTSVDPKRNITTFDQHFAEIAARGEVWEGWGAGPISLAFGASYRNESIYQVVQDTANQASIHDVGPAGSPIPGEYHPCTTNAATNAALGLRGVSPPDCNNTVAHQFSKVSNIQGEAEVWEAFAETLIPIFDTGRGTSLTGNLAGRWADYSGSGTIWAYKGGLDFSVIDGIRLRGTYSRDVRAGNLSERFDKTGGVGNVLDPRDPTANPTWGGQTYQVTIFSGGNPNIEPEKADTYTAGVVVQPAFIPGFSASIDWYLVQIEDAIATVGTNEVARRCFEDGEQTFCSLITTDPTQSDKIILVGNQFVNVAQSEVEGIDAELGYSTDINVLGGDERLSGRAFFTWLIDREDVGATGAVTRFDDLTGIAPDTGAAGQFPSFKATGNLNYTNGPFGLFVQGRYIGQGKRTHRIGTADASPANIADNTVPSVVYVDLRASYEFEVAGADLELWGSVTNLFDRDPPVTGTFSTFTGSSTQFNAGLFDVLGRRYTAGVRLRM